MTFNNGSKYVKADYFTTDEHVITFSVKEEDGNHTKVAAFPTKNVLAVIQREHDGA